MSGEATADPASVSRFRLGVRRLLEAISRRLNRVEDHQLRQADKLDSHHVETMAKLDRVLEAIKPLALAYDQIPELIRQNEEMRREYQSKARN